MDSVRVHAPTFEQHHSGLGVGTPTPRISWRFSSVDNTGHGWEQKAYEIEVLQGPNSESAVYKVDNGDSVLVPWPGPALVSRERAQVRIRVYGDYQRFEDLQTSRPSEWSPWATVECALLELNDWTAKPITSTERVEEDGLLRPILLRKDFELPNNRGMVTRARLYITAFGVYLATINGTRVDNSEMAPGWTSYSHRHNYQVLDVTTLLNSGSLNAIGAEVAEGWYCGRLGFLGGKRFNYGEEIGLLAQLEVEFDQGEKFTLVSDNTWRCHLSPLLQSGIYDGEIYDMKLDVHGWVNSVAFDKSSWLPVKIMDFPKARLVSQNAPPVRVNEEVKPVSIHKSPSGKVILDFGQNLVGKLFIKSLSRPKGHQITFRHAEVLEAGELGVRPLRGVKARDTIIFSEKELSDWTPKFTFHGFRYVQVDGWTTSDVDQPLSLDSITALVLHTGLKRTGWFECSESMVNRLHQNALWSMRGNFLSIPTDCPQRDERLGWTGDIQVFAPSANFLYNTFGMLGEWLEDVAAEQSDNNGIPPFVVPNVIGHMWPSTPQAIWDDVTVLTPWAVYQSSGDLGVLERQYPSMVAWVDNGVRRCSDGLWDPELWQLGDWLDPQAPPDEPGDARTDSTLVADTYLVHVTTTLAQISSKLGREIDAARFLADSRRLKAVFQHKYIAPSGRLVGDTQTALALALTFNLFDTSDQIKVASNRLARLVKLAKFRVGTGFAGTPVILHALTKTGHSQLAYRMLLEKSCPSWLYPITMGATTMWERWDSMLPDGSINPGEMTSFNHYALGSVVNWLHAVVGGISPRKPGWKEILVKPQPGGTIKNAQVRYESVYGLVECKWALSEGKEGGVFKMELVVPLNSKAWVILPSEKSDGDGFEVGSGKYTFECTYVAQEWPPKAVNPYMRDDDKDRWV
jgi:alpha-L-rhamnosidase